MKPEPGLEWHGDNVSMADVLVARDGIRKKFAQSEMGDNEHPSPRNCILALVAVAASDVEEKRAHSVAGVLGKDHPTQVIVIRDDPALRGGQLGGSITTDVYRPESGCPMQCETVTLRVHGAAGDHLAGLINPLLSSGVPTYMWWVGTPPFGTRELYDALKVGDALVVDSSRFTTPYRSFLELTQVSSTSHSRMGIADFQWARLKPWRETLGQFFAPADRRAFLNGISQVGIDYAGEGRGNRTAAALLTGWLGSALGWKLQQAAAGGGGVVAAQFVAETWRPIDVAFRSVPKGHLADGAVSAIRIVGAAGGRTFQLNVLRDPERPRKPAPDIGAGGFQSRHATGGEDDAGLEIAQRRAAWHRDVLHENGQNLHHTATGELVGDSPRTPTVFVSERRRADNSLVLLTLIEIGGAEPLRHVQQVEREDDATLLLQILSDGTHDQVYSRSLASAAELMRKI